MKGRLFVVIALAAILLSAVVAEAAIYSENFEGAGWGQFVKDAPLNWTNLLGVSYTPDVKISPQTGGPWVGNTGKYIDGSTAGGWKPGYAKSPVVFPTTGQLLLKWDLYVTANTGWSGLYMSYHTGLPDGVSVGWFAGQSAGKLYFYDNFSSSTYPLTQANDFMGKTVHAQIGFDFTAGSQKVWGILDTDDGFHFATGDLPVNNNEAWKFPLINQLAYGGGTAGNSMSVDNIMLVPEPGSLLALATGLVGLVGLRRLRRR